MPGYMCRTNTLPSAIAIQAGIYPVRIVQVGLLNSDSLQQGLVNFDWYTGTTLSGGTAGTVYPLRGGAPSASTTAWTGTLTYSGSDRHIGVVSVAAASKVSLNYAEFASPGSGNFQPSLDLIISPGQVFACTDVGGATNLDVELYFEELRIR